jgi:hypothetical protein
MTFALLAPLVAAIQALSFGCGGGPFCSPKDINAKLKEAAPKGGTVEIGSCLVSGAIEVPAGATLKGMGADRSVIAGDGAHAAVLVRADQGTTVVSGFKILSKGPAGLVARGSGSVRIEGVTVEATAGVALGAENLGKVEMATVSVSGPVTMANASSVSNQVTPADNATHGLVLVNVSEADLSDVKASGFASVGALFAGSTVSWSRGGSSDNLGLGVQVEGGKVTLDSLSVCRTLQGVLLLPAFGLAVTGGAEVSTTALKVCENQGFGLLQDGGTASHAQIDLEDNMNAAFWAQHTERLDLTGMATGNHFAGIVLVDAQNAAIHDAQISNTVLATRVFHGSTMEYQVGDGVQLVDAADTTVLKDTTIANNDRAGILVDLGGSTAKAMTFDNVTVRVSGALQHGAIAENGPAPSGWDAGIRREGTTGSLDQSFAGMIPAVKIVGPCNLPRPTDLGTAGLASLTGI